MNQVPYQDLLSRFSAALPEAVGIYLLNGHGQYLGQLSLEPVNANTLELATSTAYVQLLCFSSENSPVFSTIETRTELVVISVLRRDLAVVLVGPSDWNVVLLRRVLKQLLATAQEEILPLEPITEEQMTQAPATSPSAPTPSAKRNDQGLPGMTYAQLRRIERMRQISEVANAS